MTNYDVLVLGELLKNEIHNIKHLQGAKLSYYISKNIDIINNKISEIHKSIVKSEEFAAYDSKRIELCETYCKKNEFGELIKKQIDENNYEYDVDIDNPDWIKDMNELKSTYSDEINNRNLQIEKYNKLLFEESTIDLKMFPLDIVPDNITVELMTIIKNFIIEN